MDIKLFDVIDKITTTENWLARTKYSRYFTQYQTKKLYAKYKHKENSTDVKNHYMEIAQAFIAKYPSIFMFDKSLPEKRMSLFLSGQLIQKDPELAKNLMESNVDDIRRYNFIDKTFLEDAWNNTNSIKLNLINLPDNGYAYEAKKLNKALGVAPCGAGELFSVLVELSDKTKAEIKDEDILKAIVAKSIKKGELKGKYLDVLKKLLTKRGLSKVVEAKHVRQTYSKMSMPIFEREMAWMLKNAIETCLELEDISEIDREEILYRLVEKQHSWSQLREYLPSAYKGFFQQIKKSSFPFQISGQMIKQTCSAALDESQKELEKGLDGIFSKSISKELSKLKYRIRYLKTGAKTRQALLDSSTAAIILMRSSYQFSDAPVDSIIDLFFTLRERQVNENEIRNLVTKLFDLNRFMDDGRPTREFHDIYERYLPDLIKLFKNLPKNPAYKKFYSKIVKLIVSELGGSDVRTQGMRALSAKLPSKIQYVIDEEFTSLSALVGLCLFSKEQEIEINDKIESLSIKRLGDEKSFGKMIREMSMGDRMDDILKNYDKAGEHKTLLSKPIIKSIGRLNFALVSHNYDVSLLAVGVSGVCISPGSHYHKQQHIKECVNLIVYDEKEIYLWGLMVKAKEDYKWFLNNFQGRVPNRYAKFKNEIKDECINLMSEVGDVYMLEHYFNAIHIHDGLKHVELKKLTLPCMRLDVYQNAKGELENTSLYEVKMKKGDNHAIK